MFKSLLIANRGEIAVRIMRTAKRLGMRTIAVYSDADRDALHVATADDAYRIGPPPAAQSYLDIDRVIAAARASGAEAVHPGYGFLSENADFADAVTKAGLTFVGPPASAIRAMGLKDAAKALMQRAGIPVVPGYHGEKQDAAHLAREAAAIGYPVLIKARAGGGGKGMRRVDTAEALVPALDSAMREAAASFGDPRVIIERYVTAPRHIEVQVFADTHGNVIHLGERDCSLQRRHQKVIEEQPAPGVTEQLRSQIGAIAVQAARAIGYAGAGTVEFIADTSSGRLSAGSFYFMEMNTRLQVEHPVTEAVTGLDLVAWQLRVAAGEPLPLSQERVTFNGHAFEARLYAEDAARDFVPATGTLHVLALPDDRARVDTGVRQGDRVSPYYDPMIAKIIAHGATRADALQKFVAALEATRVAGTVTNVSFLQALAKTAQFQQAAFDTGLIERHLPMLTASASPPKEAFAIAAMVALGLARPPQTPDPWGALPGWRQWAGSQQITALKVAGKDVLVRVDGTAKSSYRVGAPDGALDVTLVGADLDETVRLEIDGRIVTATAIETGGEITVSLDGSTYSFARPDPSHAHEEDVVEGDAVTAPMPGTIKAVGAVAGERVTRGAPLLVIEAMKMEYTMTSPRDGRIAEVLVSKGATVEAGAVLVTLAPSAV